jgi:hypothetical protein
MVLDVSLSYLEETQSVIAERENLRKLIVLWKINPKMKIRFIAVYVLLAFLGIVWVLVFFSLNDSNTAFKFINILF